FRHIGYYFGRLPPSKTRKHSRTRLAVRPRKADAAQHAKEQALQSREALEEKVKNVNAALTAAAPATSRASFAEDVHKANGAIKEDALRHSVGAAVRILNS